MYGVKSFGLRALSSERYIWIENWKALSFSFILSLYTCTAGQLCCWSVYQCCRSLQLCCRSVHMCYRLVHLCYGLVYQCYRSVHLCCRSVHLCCCPGSSPPTVLLRLDGLIKGKIKVSNVSRVPWYDMMYYGTIVP